MGEAENIKCAEMVASIVPGGYRVVRGVRLELHGKPKAVQSFRFASAGGFTRKYQPKETVEWKTFIRLSALQQLPDGWQMFQNGALLCVYHEFVFPFPSSMTKKERAWVDSGNVKLNGHRPDLSDNLRKGVNDALTGTVWCDDSIIVADRGMKRYGDEPKTIVEVAEIAPLYRTDSMQ